MNNINTMNNNRYVWADIAKGVCILLVVATHIITMLYQVPFTLDGIKFSEQFIRTWELFYKVLSPLRMPLFFMISGFLAAKYVNHDPGISVSKGFQNKFINLLWLYLIWNLIHWFCIYYLNKLIDFSSASYLGQKEVVTIQPIFYSLLNLTMGYSGLWYFYALALYFLLFSLFRKQKVVVISIILLIYTFIAIFNIELPWGPKALLQNALYFALGAYWKGQIIRLSLNPSIKVIFLAVLAILVTIIFLYFDIKIRYLASSALVFFFIWLISKCERFYGSFFFRSLIFFGKNTLYIYIFHTLLIELFVVISVSSWFSHLSTNITLTYTWLLLSPILLTLVLSVISAWMGRILLRLQPWLFTLPVFNADKK